VTPAPQPAGAPATVPPRPGQGVADGAAPGVRAPAASLPAAPAATGRIALSAGVALPQSLPDGTAILCSMDYRWTGIPPDNAQYLWVVKLGNGRQVTGTANVTESKGTIPVVLRRVRPEEGPFQGAVFWRRAGSDAAHEPISDFIDLK
jgi:hypothetical protein